MFVQDLENCWRNFPHRVSKVLSRMNGQGQHCINMNGGRWRIDLHFNVNLPKHHGFDFYNAYNLDFDKQGLFPNMGFARNYNKLRAK